MFIQRIVIQNLRALRSIDHELTLWSGQRASLTCVRGLNGSGKTTYLESIASLWHKFGQWVESDKYIAPSREDPLRDAGLCAMQLVDLPGPLNTLWLVFGREELWEAIPNRGASQAFGIVFSGKSGKPALLQTEVTRSVSAFWGETYKQLLRPSLVNTPPHLLPNILFLGAEDRVLQPLRGDLSELAVEQAFRWLARYTPTERKEGHLENQMVEIRDVDPERYRAIGAAIKQVLPQLELLDRLEGRRRRPLVRVAGVERPLTLDLLSAGERAAFISLFMIHRWLGEGGVVLIDEPELHQHLSLMRLNLAALERFVVDKKHGQIIVASHAPEVWDQCSTGRIFDLKRQGQNDAA